jgi:hypothetical protein
VALSKAAMVRRLVALGFAIGVVAWSPASHACSCADWRDTARRVDAADAVFVGSVDTIDVPWVMRPAVAEAFLQLPLYVVYAVDHEIRVRFDVEHRYKGALGEQVWVNTGDFPGFDCESPTMFSNSSQRWLVFAHERDDGELHVTHCMYPIGEDDRPEEFVARLGELPPPVAEPDPSAAFSTYHGRSPWRTSALFAGAAIVLVWLRRKRVARSRARAGIVACTSKW